MTSGAALVRFLLSSGGVVSVLATLAAWNLLRPGRAPRRALALAALFYTVCACYPVPHAVARWLARPFHPLTRDDVPPGRTVVVLLGSGNFTIESWSHDRLSVLDPVGADRTMEAFRAFRLLNADWLISSGGEPDPTDPDLPAGVGMRDTLVHLGLPADRIIVEQSSRTTRDEAVEVAGMVRSVGAEQVVLVTSAIHMRRSLAVFRSVGLSAIPAIARDSEHASSGWQNRLPSADGLQEAHDVCHEILGLLYYRIRGWQR